MFFNNTVINLHQISDAVWMERVFLLLGKHYQFVSAQQLEDYYYRDNRLRNSCHITFDDGDESFYQVVFPILKRLQIPVSIYVSPKAAIEGSSFWFQKFKAVDKSILKQAILETEKFAPISNYVQHFPAIVLCKSMEVKELNRIIDLCLSGRESHIVIAKNMNVDQIKEVASSGLVEVGAHTMNHPVLYNESDASAEWEIGSSVAELSKMLDKPIECFAFPNGRFGLDYSNREIELLRNSGIKLSFSTKHIGFSKKNNPLDVPRKGLSVGSDSVILPKLVMGKRWDQFKKAIRGKDETDQRLLLQTILEQVVSGNSEAT